MVYEKDEIYTIRNLEERDVEEIVKGEIEQGQNITDEKYGTRLKDQCDEKCISLVAEYKGFVAGYINVYFHAEEGPFGKHGLPEIVDFGVLEKFRNHGIG